LIDSKSGKGELHTMSNSGGTSIFQTLNDMKTQIEGLKDGMGMMQSETPAIVQGSKKDFYR
jgi:hypothetical protein